jgi:sugar/nucleoside kinase (ribokinase family)
VGKPSRGVVAVGGLSISRGRGVGSGAPPPADGSALRAAVGAWLVGAEAAVCAAIDVAFPTDVILDITRAGIDLSRLRPRSILQTGSDANGDPTPAQLASLSPRWSAHICGMVLPHQRDIVRALAQRVALVTLDAPCHAGANKSHADDVLALAANSDAFLPSLKDLAGLWPGRPPRELLRLIAGRGVPAAVIRLGVGGSIGIQDGTITCMPAFPVTASGVTGGGDAYAGAFTAVFAGDRDLPKAMAWATAAASAVVEAGGALDPLNQFARSRVESRAGALLDEMQRVPI